MGKLFWDKMVKGKGTQSFGKRHGRVHTLCRRCGKKSFHIQGGACSHCGFGRMTKIRKYSGWNTKWCQKNGERSGRMRFKKTIARRAKNGFRSGLAQKA